MQTWHGSLYWHRVIIGIGEDYTYMCMWAATAGKYYHHCDLLFLEDLDSRRAFYQNTVLEPPIYNPAYDGGYCSDNIWGKMYVRKGCEHCTSKGMIQTDWGLFLNSTITFM